MSSTSKKHANFVSEPMKGKCVTALPGIGPKLGVRMASQGYDKATTVLGEYLIRNGDKESFRGFVQDVSKANTKQADDCHQGLKEWSSEFL